MLISMSTFTKNIKIRNLLAVQVLSTRSTAHRLLNEITKMSSRKHFQLDFNDIAFASRSFMDELNVLATQNEITFDKVNMNEQIQKMAQLVQDTDNNHFVASKNDDAQANFMSI